MIMYTQHQYTITPCNAVRLLWAAAFTLLCMLGRSSSVHAAAGHTALGGTIETSLAPPPSKDGDAQIVATQLGRKIPFDASFYDESGNQVTVGSYFPNGKPNKPTIITLGYYQCPMLCNLVLNALIDTLQGSDLALGRDFRILSFSIDERENVDLSNKKREAYLQSLRKAYGDNQRIAQEEWHFHTGNAAAIAQLADGIGFQYRWDELSQQFAHGAGIFLISPDGTLTRILWGLAFDPKDFKMAVVEASQGKVGTIVDRILISCFRYDNMEHKYTVYAWGIMRLAGIIMVVLVATFLFRSWYQERKKANIVSV